MMVEIIDESDFPCDLSIHTDDIEDTFVYKQLVELRGTAELSKQEITAILYILGMDVTKLFGLEKLEDDAGFISIYSGEIKTGGSRWVGLQRKGWKWRKYGEANMKKFLYGEYVPVMIDMFTNPQKWQKLINKKDEELLCILSLLLKTVPAAQL